MRHLFPLTQPDEAGISVLVYLEEKTEAMTPPNVIGKATLFSTVAQGPVYQQLS